MAKVVDFSSIHIAICPLFSDTLALFVSFLELVLMRADLFLNISSMLLLSSSLLKRPISCSLIAQSTLIYVSIFATWWLMSSLALCRWSLKSISGVFIKKSFWVLFCAMGFYTKRAF